MKRVLSGLKSSGDATLGNYLGAIKRWVELQDQSGVESFYFVPNLHALNTRPNPEILHRDTLSNAAWLIAAGLDPAKVTLFVQSQVPAHSELTSILVNYVTMGELNRMTQFKDKSQKAGSEGQVVGLFTYPVLMASDILLYDADEVPVGDDQIQHVELARDIATRFNNLYGETFKVPKATKPEVAARIMSLQDPSSKMSKSDDDHSGNIMLGDGADDIEQKIKRAVTDSGSEIQAGKDKPAITNLLEIFSSVTGRAVKDIEKEYAGQRYGAFKAGLAEAVIGLLEPIQQRQAELMADEKALIKILEEGSAKAAIIAEEKLKTVKKTVGLL